MCGFRYRHEVVTAAPKSPQNKPPKLRHPDPVLEAIARTHWRLALRAVYRAITERTTLICGTRGKGDEGKGQGVCRDRPM